MLVLMSCGTLVGLSPADAHANLTSANPAPNASTKGAPAQVQMHFGQPTIPDRRTKVQVVVPSGRNIATGAPVSDGLGVAQRLADSHEKGWYRVRYSVVFIDGHLASGVFRFQVTTFERPGPSHRGWFLLLGGVVVYFALSVLRYTRHSSDMRSPPVVRTGG
ncbi:MAG: copper resistance CopC family protein [Nocardioidaceae bacterium]